MRGPEMRPGVARRHDNITHLLRFQLQTPIIHTTPSAFEVSSKAEA